MEGARTISTCRRNVEDRLRSCKTVSRGDHIYERYRGCKSPPPSPAPLESSQVDHYARCSRNFVFPSAIPGSVFRATACAGGNSQHTSAVPWSATIYIRLCAELPNGISKPEVERYSPVCWFIAIINTRIILRDTAVKTDVKIRFQYCRLRQIQVRAMIDDHNPIANPLNPRRRALNKKQPEKSGRVFVYYMLTIRSLVIKLLRARTSTRNGRFYAAVSVELAVLSVIHAVRAAREEWFYNASKIPEFHSIVGLIRTQNGNTRIELCSRMSFRPSNFRNWNVIKCRNRPTLPKYSALCFALIIFYPLLL